MYNEIQRNNLVSVCKTCHPLHMSSHNLPPLKVIPPKVSCNVCLKTIAVNHIKVSCSCCQKYSHIKCNKIDSQMYDKILKDHDPILCSNCKSDNIPFHNITDIQLSAVNKCIEVNSEIHDETLIKSSTLTNFFREVNDSFSIQQPLGLKDDESDKVIINCKYVDLCKFSPPIDKKKNISILHTNIGSLEKHID